MFVMAPLWSRFSSSLHRALSTDPFPHQFRDAALTRLNQYHLHKAIP